MKYTKENIKREKLPEWANCWAQNIKTGEIQPAFYSHAKDELTDEYGAEMFGWVDITYTISMFNKKWFKILFWSLLFVFCIFAYAGIILKQENNALEKTFKNERCGGAKESCEKYLK